MGTTRCQEAKSVLRKSIPVAQRVFGENHDLTLSIRANYARALYLNPDATLDHLREAVMTLEETTRIARRVLGGAQPTTERIGNTLREARAVLAARETSRA